MLVLPEIALAIDEAVKAGVFRRAERLNPRSAKTWAGLAAPHSAAVKGHLDNAMKGPRAASARPS